jgi:hypothetical protein
MAIGMAESTGDKERWKMMQNRRRCKKITLKKAYRLGKFPEVDVFIAICINGQYTTYNSTNEELLLMKEIVCY